MNPKKDDSALLPEGLPDITPREVRAVARAASEADTDPGEGPRERPADDPKHENATREHVAQTRPEGVRRRPVPVVGADEVTDPDASTASDDRRRMPEGGSSEPSNTASDDRRRMPEGGSSEPINTAREDVPTRPQDVIAVRRR